MTFTPKVWQNEEAGGTRLNAAGLIDLETRLAAYVDLMTPIYTWPGDTPPDPGEYPEGKIWIEVYE